MDKCTVFRFINPKTRKLVRSRDVAFLSEAVGGSSSKCPVDISEEPNDPDVSKFEFEEEIDITPILEGVPVNKEPLRRGTRIRQKPDFLYFAAEQLEHFDDVPLTIQEAFKRTDADEWKADRWWFTVRQEADQNEMGIS